MKLLYEYEKNEIGHRIKLETGGNFLELSSAVGRLMQQIFFNMPEPDRFIFQKACQIMTANDSSIWKPEEGVKIDLAALERQRGEQ